MRTILALTLAATAIWTAGTARGGTFQAFVNDFDGFVEAAGEVTIIDFETLPDGNRAFSGALITPEFNYTDLGVTFSTQAPRLNISGNPISGFNLCACPEQSNDPNRNWIIADFVDSVSAVGFFYGGRSTLTIFNEFEIDFANVGFAGSGSGFFVGLVSEDPIAFATADAGRNSEIINSFAFAPIPEPATLVLFGIGAAAVIRHGRRLKSD